MTMGPILDERYRREMARRLELTERLIKALEKGHLTGTEDLSRSNREVLLVMLEVLAYQRDFGTHGLLVFPELAKYLETLKQRGD